MSVHKECEFIEHSDLLWIFSWKRFFAGGILSLSAMLSCVLWASAQLEEDRELQIFSLPLCMLLERHHSSQSRLPLKWAVGFYHFLFRSDPKIRKGIPLRSESLTETPDASRTANFSPITALTKTVCRKFSFPNLWISSWLQNLLFWTGHGDGFETAISDSNIHPFSSLIWCSIWKFIYLCIFKYCTTHDKCHVKFLCILILQNT